MNKKKRSPYLLLLPFLPFPLLLIPYSLINQHFIVDWFGCGCPKIDEFGNTVHPDFNANDFTRLFWFIVSIGTTVGAVFLSRIIPKEKIWLRVIYVVFVLAVSLFISHHFCQMMMVK